MGPIGIAVQKEIPGQGQAGGFEAETLERYPDPLPVPIQRCQDLAA